MTNFTTDQKAMLLTQIAAHVPDFHYIAPPDGRTPHLAGPDGMAIFIGSARDRNKLHIHGAWPMDGHRCMSPRSWGAVSHAEDSDISINVSAERGPEAIAREIVRRFLGPYRNLYRKCRERQAEHEAYQNRAHKTACAIASAAGLAAPELGDDKSQYTLHIGNVTTRGWYGDARTNADSVDLHLRSITPAMAARILGLLYTAEAGQEDTAA
jgi:hypothetical protein